MTEEYIKMRGDHAVGGHDPNEELLRDIEGTTEVNPDEIILDVESPSPQDKDTKEAEIIIEEVDTKE